MFSDLQLKISSLANLLRYNFYLVNFPITVLPRPGGGFVQLECIVEFNPGSSPAKRPVAYQIFPQEEWQSVIHAWQGVKVGLNESLEFKLDPIQATAKLPELDLPAQAEIKLKMAGQAGLVFGPFDYDIKRPKIISRGQECQGLLGMEAKAITQEALFRSCCRFRRKYPGWMPSVS
jgi:hypothetical protein